MLKIAGGLLVYEIYAATTVQHQGAVIQVLLTKRLSVPLRILQYIQQVSEVYLLPAAATANYNVIDIQRLARIQRNSNVVNGARGVARLHVRKC